MSETVQEAKRFYTAHEVAEKLGVSDTTGYRIVKKLNEELEEQGYITIPGKISIRYFEEKTYM